MSSIKTDPDPLNRRLFAATGEWQTMRAGFNWPRVSHFNIAQVCCDDWAAFDPDRLAVIHIGADGSREAWTFGRLKAASDALAHSFRARGIRRGDRVAVLLAQAPEVLVTHLAAYKLGAVALPLFALFGPDALRYRLADSGARAVLTDAGGVETLMALRADLPDLAEIYSVDPAPAPIRVLADEIAAARGVFEPVATAPDDPRRFDLYFRHDRRPKGRATCTSLSFGASAVDGGQS